MTERAPASAWRRLRGKLSSLCYTPGNPRGMQDTRLPRHAPWGRFAVYGYDGTVYAAVVLMGTGRALVSLGPPHCGWKSHLIDEYSAPRGMPAYEFLA